MKAGPDNPSAAGSSSSAAASTSAAPPPLPEKDYPVGAREQQQQQQQKYGGSRPGTALQSHQPAVPGALPPTPAGSEGEPEPFVFSLPQAAPRWPETQAQSPPRNSTSTTSSSRSFTSRHALHSPPALYLRALVAPGQQTTPAGSVKSVSESASFADYV